MKNKLISVRSSFSKGRSSDKNNRIMNAAEIQSRKNNLSGWRTAIILIPLLIVLLIAVITVLFVIRYNSVKKEAAVTEPSYEHLSVLSAENSQKMLMLVSPKTPLPADYPLKLANYRNIRVDELIVSDLDEMMKSAEAKGIHLQLAEGYLSAEEQNERYEDEVRRLMAREGKTAIRAAEEAELTAPKSNHADACTGLSVRFQSDSDTDFTESEDYYWLITNAYRYGFILRYPDNKQKFTEHHADPCLFRYVGKNNAAKLVTLDMCLDEYLIYLDAR